MVVACLRYKTTVRRRDRLRPLVSSDLISRRGRFNSNEYEKSKKVGPPLHLPSPPFVRSFSCSNYLYSERSQVLISFVIMSFFFLYLIFFSGHTFSSSIQLKFFNTVVNSYNLFDLQLTR